MTGTTRGRRELLRRALGLGGVTDTVAALEERVAELEADHVRFAELLDLVQELLLPVALQDREKVAALVERYTDELEGIDRETPVEAPTIREVPSSPDGDRAP